MSVAWRWPAEWEAQDAIVLAWPHAGTDWAPILAAVEGSYRELVRAILGYQDVVLIVADAAVRARAAEVLGHGLNLLPGRLHWVELPYNDTWLRDSGPLTLLDVSGRPRWLDFKFTAWGEKFEAGLDDQLPSGLQRQPLFRHLDIERVDFALEGGAIESDGRGSLLTTWTCLERRHPGLSRRQIEATLRAHLHVSRVLGLSHGELQGDDTDAHVDTLARFAAPDRIVYQACENPEDPHYAPLQAMAMELATLRTPAGGAYELYPLPWAPAVSDEDGRRLAASYANFLIINGAVLLPGYDLPTDLDAAEVMEAAFPGREIVLVPCRPFIEQNGSLHCLTMQLPRGSLA